MFQSWIQAYPCPGEWSKNSGRRKHGDGIRTEHVPVMLLLGMARSIANPCRECQCRQNLRSFSKDRKFVVRRNIRQMKAQTMTARTTKARRWHKNQTCFESGQSETTKTQGWHKKLTCFSRDPCLDVGSTLAGLWWAPHHLMNSTLSTVRFNMFHIHTVITR